VNESFEHVPVIPPRVVHDIPAVDDKWLARFASVPTTDIADQVGQLYTMTGIGALYRPITRAAGRAVTVKTWPGDGLTVHGAAAMAGAGDFLVVDARGYLGVTGGGFHMLQGPRSRGLRGFIIDGALRDAEEFEEVGFPVFGRARATHASAKRKAGEINVPVSCGGVVVEAGDLVVADGEGAVVVPHRYIPVVWAALERQGGNPVPGPPDLESADARRRENFLRAFEAAGGQQVAFVSSWPAGDTEREV
jgi:4-hydroxy-4-methyl-2-oxoglutarate aldolase